VELQGFFNISGSKPIPAAGKGAATPPQPQDPTLSNFLLILRNPDCAATAACRSSVVNQLDALGCQNHQFNANIGAMETTCPPKGDPTKAFSASREALAALRRVPEVKAASRNRLISRINPIEVVTEQSFTNFHLNPLPAAPSTDEVTAASFSNPANPKVRAQNTRGRTRPKTTGSSTPQATPPASNPGAAVNTTQWGLDRIDDLTGTDGSFSSCPSQVTARGPKDKRRHPL
jgi:hypothetical protein